MSAAGGVLAVMREAWRWLPVKRDRISERFNEAIATVEAMAGALEEIATVAHSDQSESDLPTVLAWLASVVDPVLASFDGSAAPAGDGIGPGGTVDTDDDLPGMWERADFEGGATDAKPAAPAGGGDEVRWPERMVNLPDPDGGTDRIIGFRIPEGDPILGDYGLSEPLAWLRSVTVDRRLASAGSAPSPSADPTQPCPYRKRCVCLSACKYGFASDCAAPTPEQQS